MSRSSAEDDEERAHRLTEMRERIKAFKAFVGESQRNELALVTDPIFRFSDPARTFSDGTIWAWGEKGRPAALITIERYETFWSYELVSLTTGQLQVTRPDGVRWSPSQPGVDLKPMPDAPTPAERESARLRQMRDIARRFALSETFREETYELRLLPNPAHRYSDDDDGLVDGALFVYAYGTNPETVLVVEARGAPSGAASWQYGFVRLTAAAVSAKIGDTLAWSVEPWVRPTYTNFQLP
ncbi:MAG TPA: hypothetical protein VG826_01060 [Pirellulales bacterium]|nr:hypothetical protein [Pirellulales bacterium]